MKKSIFLVPVTFLSIISLANLDGALPENTAAPEEFTCGRAPCHNVPVNVGDAQMSIHVGDDQVVYHADSIYEVTVRIQNPMTARNGFQILALTENFQNAGVWILTQPDRMKIISGFSFPDRKYVTHRAPGNQQNEWIMNWRAPAGNAGKIRFYASVLSANDNGFNTGDEVYNTNIVLDPATATATGEVVKEVYKVYPTPSNTGFCIELPVMDENFQLSLYNSSQMLVKKLEVNQGGLHFIDTSNLSSGVYFLKIEFWGTQAVKKIFIQ